MKKVSTSRVQVLFVKKICAGSDVKLFILFARRVQTESATGSVSSNKVRTTLAIAVEGIEFDTQACMLRIKGRNVEENQYVKVGISC